MVVCSGMKGESQPLPLNSTRDNPFQIGQTDMFTVSCDNELTRGILVLFIILYLYNLSHCMRKPTRSDTNQAVQSQKMVRGLKFWT